MSKIIGRFVPTGAPDYRQPFNVLTMEPSKYLAPAWQGKREDGEEYHVIERAWKFEPTWSGDGLPSVGVECEYMKHGRDAVGTWWCGTVKYVSDCTVVIKTNGCAGETVGHPCNFEFRPIRSEAERKRDAEVDELIEAITLTLADIYASQRLMDAIAEGKIPGVKLSD